MYIKDVEIKGKTYKYVYYKCGNVEVCVGYLDQFCNLVVYSREKK